jgi:peroxiredoxin
MKAGSRGKKDRPSTLYLRTSDPAGAGRVQCHCDNVADVTPIQRRRNSTLAIIAAAALLLAVAAPLAIGLHALLAQSNRPVWTAQEKPIADQISGLRSLPDDFRASVTKQLALQIRDLPAGMNKLRLAYGLANLSTEGDFGHDTLQEVATTLADALRESPPPAVRGAKAGQPAAPYNELAQLVRYEHVDASLDDPQFAAAMAALEADDARRKQIDFTLTDLRGTNWSLQGLRGKVVLVNFWATWCPPCRKEMPDLDELYQRFKDQGLIVLAISDEDEAKVRPFVTERNITYPILLDPGRKVNDLFHVEGIPKSFVYDRAGNLVAQSIDMRTQKQFLDMLAEAGLH